MTPASSLITAGSPTKSSSCSAARRRRGRNREADGDRPPGRALVAELGPAAGHELLELGPDRVIQRRRLVCLERLGADLAGPGRRVLAALLEPALVIRRRGQQRPVEELAETLPRVLRAEEMPAVPDLLVRPER